MLNRLGRETFGRLIIYLNLFKILSKILKYFHNYDLQIDCPIRVS